MIGVAATGQTTGGGAGVDELELLDAMQQLWESVGINTVEGDPVPSASTLRWFQSTGEDNQHNIVCGVEHSGSQIRVYTAVDFNTTAMDATLSLAADQTGYTNQDLTNPSAHTTAPTLFSEWIARDNATPYSYAMVANKDGLAAWGDYTEGGGPAQFFICLGKLTASTRSLYEQGRAKVASVGASIAPGTPANQRLITLDRSILPALKDNGFVGSPYPDDPFKQSLFFQTVEIAGVIKADFAKTERAEIVEGTLEDSGGVTRFEIIVDQASSKLFGSVGGDSATTNDRYASRAARCVGDIVAIHAEPTVAVCGATSANNKHFDGATANALVMCDPWGMQNAIIVVHLANQRADTEANMDPDLVTNYGNWFHINALVNDFPVGIPVQANAEGKKNAGYLPNAIMTVNDNLSPPSFSTFKIDNDMSRVFYVMAQLDPDGLGTPTGFPSDDCCYAIGPFVTP